MNKYLNSKWTSVDKICSWKYYGVRNIIKKQKRLELFTAYDKCISIIIEIKEIKDNIKWLPSWKEIV